jgi:adenylate kinase family enzyme
MAENRIVVVGTTGSGKTTLAAQLGERWQIPHIELDAIHWGPNWTEMPTDLFRAQLTETLSGDCWVVDGNYSKVRDIVWGRATTLIWLDYPFSLIFYRLMKRTLHRVFWREKLWNNNQESFRNTFFRKDSLIWWFFKTYRRNKQRYPKLFAEPAYAHLTVIRLCSPRATREWLTKG